LGTYPPDKVVAGTMELYSEVITDCNDIVDRIDEIWEDEYRVVFDNAEKYFSEIDSLMKEYLAEYCDLHGVVYDRVSDLKLIRQISGEDEYIENTWQYPNVVCALLFLNTINYGGEIEFLEFDIQAVPIEGRLMIFPASYAFAYKLQPPTFGKKYMAACWAQQIPQ